MGRGNVRTTNPYEGLWYVDYDDLYIYENADGETRYRGELDYADLTSGEWNEDEMASRLEYEELIYNFVDGFEEMFPSFEHITDELWLGRSRRVIMESKLFYVAIEDNEWSVAFELIQKEEPYGFNWMENLQKRRYRSYLNGIKKVLLDYLPKIYARNGAWMSTPIWTNEEYEKGVQNGLLNAAAT